VRQHARIVRLAKFRYRLVPQHAQTVLWAGRRSQQVRQYARIVRRVRLRPLRERRRAQTALRAPLLKLLGRLLARTASLVPLQTRQARQYAQIAWPALSVLVPVNRLVKTALRAPLRPPRVRLVAPTVRWVPSLREWAIPSAFLPKLGLSSILRVPQFQSCAPSDSTATLRGLPSAAVARSFLPGGTFLTSRVKLPVRLVLAVTPKRPHAMPQQASVNAMGY
jgi:hypothetical protein